MPGPKNKKRGPNSGAAMPLGGKLQREAAVALYRHWTRLTVSSGCRRPTCPGRRDMCPRVKALQHQPRPQQRQKTLRAAHKKSARGPPQRGPKPAARKGKTRQNSKLNPTGKPSPGR